MYAQKGNKYLDTAYQENKTMKYIRTPTELWTSLNDEFQFTLDTCASSKNHLCDLYCTKETDGLKQDWGTHTAYCHPMYDKWIPKWVKKCALRTKGVSVMLLPASTHTQYFHTWIYNKPNVEVRFLPCPHKNGKAGWFFSTDDGETSPAVGYIRPLMVVIFRPQS